MVAQATGCARRVERIESFFEEVVVQNTRGQTPGFRFDLVIAHAFVIFPGAGAFESAPQANVTAGLCWNENELVVTWLCKRIARV